jgi:hypothetical protein
MSFSSYAPLLINQLPISQDLPREPERLHEELELFTKRIANILNTKTGSLYSGQEFSNSELFNMTNPMTTSNVYRKGFDLVLLNAGPIAGGATVTFPHGIVGLLHSALIYASCTTADPFFFSVMGYPTVYLTATNVVFTNPLGGTALTAVFVIAEYVKT